MVKNSPTNAGGAGDLDSIPGSERSPGEGNGNPLQCSCLEKPRDGGAWWAAVYGVAQSRTRLTRLSSSIINVPNHYAPAAYCLYQIIYKFVVSINITILQIHCPKR